MTRTRRMVIFFLLMPAVMDTAGGEQRARSRDLGIQAGVLTPGRWNAITDVAGVCVGHVTLIEGEEIRTGVTAILPHQENLFLEKVPAAVYVGNGFGKLMGFTQVEELGNLETPIVLTATLNVPRAADAVLDYMLALPEMDEVRSINPVVGETNDGYLNELRKRPVTREHVLQAIRSAQSGPVAEGNVGAGTGTRCYGFKGGIGTSSRMLPSRLGGYAVGVLVQTNFGGILQIGGAPVGKELGRYYLREVVESGAASPGGSLQQADGSCMMVVATDAPLDSRNLKRLAKRAMLGLGATGSPSTSGSGDYVIAFSTAQELRIPHQRGAGGERPQLVSGKVLSNDDMSPLFQAVKEATEEAIYNSMFMATDMKGRNGHFVPAIPLDEVVRILRKHRVIGPAPSP